MIRTFQDYVDFVTTTHPARRQALRHLVAAAHYWPAPADYQTYLHN